MYHQTYPYNSYGVIVVERNSTEPSSLTPYYSTSRLLHLCYNPSSN
ncbi:MAG: hypothetical protein ACRCZS_01840 [Chroococcidiopsis sp.]